MDRRSYLQALLWVLLLIVAFAVAILANIWWSDVGFGDSVRNFQAIVTATAILVAAYFAVFKLQIFRVFAPHLTISQKVSHRGIGESYVHIDVAATLQNNSRVKVDLIEGLFLLQKIAPMEDHNVAFLHAQVFVDRTYEDILWPVIDEVYRSWKEHSLIIEPGESYQEACEFIVDATVKSVLVYTYFYNPFSSASKGWGATTIHDIA